MSVLSNLPPGCTQADCERDCMPAKCEDCAIAECCVIFGYKEYDCPGPYDEREDWVTEYPADADLVIGELLAQVASLRVAMRRAGE